MSFCLPEEAIVRRYQGALNVAQPVKPTTQQDVAKVLLEQTHMKPPKQEPHACATEDVVLHACLRTRAVALRLQKNFIQWQKELRQKKAEENLDVEHVYGAWFQEQTREALQELPACEHERYALWASMQNRLYTAWAKDFAQEQELAYAVQLQADIVNGAQELIRHNTLRPDFVQQGLEQMVASLQESAHLQKFSKAQARELLEVKVATVMLPLIQEKKERADTATAQNLLQACAPFLPKKQVQKIRKLLKK